MALSCPVVASRSRPLQVCQPGISCSQGFRTSSLLRIVLVELLEVLVLLVAEALHVKRLGGERVIAFPLAVLGRAAAPVVVVRDGSEQGGGRLIVAAHL